MNTLNDTMTSDTLTTADAEKLEQLERPASRDIATGTFDTPYDAGFDCGKRGANTDNCHFRYFSSQERTQEWERGHREATADD